MKNSAKQPVKKQFVLCPRCKSKSRVLFTEFGGLQTRQCGRGHRFEYDKWIADRLVWTLLA